MSEQVHFLLDELRIVGYKDLHCLSLGKWHMKHVEDTLKAVIQTIGGLVILLALVSISGDLYSVTKI